MLRGQGMAAVTPVVLLHTFGYLLGYALPRLLGFNERTSRTGTYRRHSSCCCRNGGVVGAAGVCFLPRNAKHSQNIPLLAFHALAGAQ